MKAMLAGFAAIAIIAVGADYALKELKWSSADRGSGDAVRLGE